MRGLVKTKPKKPQSLNGLADIVRTSESLAQVLRTLDYVPEGGNYAFIKEHIAKSGLNTDHFKGQQLCTFFGFPMRDRPNFRAGDPNNRAGGRWETSCTSLSAACHVPRSTGDLSQRCVLHGRSTWGIPHALVAVSPCPPHCRRGFSWTTLPIPRIEPVPEQGTHLISTWPVVASKCCPFL